VKLPVLVRGVTVNQWFVSFTPRLE